MTSRHLSKWAGWPVGMGCLLMILGAALVRAEELKARLGTVGDSQALAVGEALDRGAIGDAPATGRHRGEDFPRSFVPPAGMYANVTVPVDESPRPRATLCVDDDVACAPCYTSIQAAIDAAGPGDTIHVYPGNYNETASSRGILGAAPPGGGQYQFGLFLPYDKPGLTIQGVDCGGTPITSAAAVQAHITTNATNSFGYSGTFIEADDVTITGLDFGPNLTDPYNVGSTQKTIELIGNNATFKYCQFTDNDINYFYGGSFYINDWRVVDPNSTPGDGDDIAHVQTYDIENCQFKFGVTIDIASGAGANSPAAGRKILNNTFDGNNDDYSAISFNGSGTCVGWFVYSVGGAVITGNTFNNLALQNIKARGLYDNSQFDWASYWNNNTFDHATAALITVSPFVPRDYTYGPTCYPNTRRIGAKIQDEIDVSASPGDTVYVKASTLDYNEDVLLNKSLTLLGQGAGSTTLRGPIGGGGSTVQITASNATVAGLKITRAGNTLADWNNPGLNLAAVAIQGLAVANVTIRDNLITQCRTGIDINNSNGHTVRNNDIVDSRTGMILRNQTDNLTIVENNIANNWTVGLVFLDASGGSNSPIQTAANCNISNNNLSGNWYGQVVDRQTGGALPAPGANLKNFSGNWWGTTTPVITVANSAEPGYGALIPVAFGGAAVPPGGQPDICGAASANFDITPMLNSGTDTNVETTLGRGTYGFQGDFSALRVTPLLAQVETGGRIQEGIDRVTNSTVYVDAGLFTEVVNLNKVGVKVIGAGVGSTIINYQGFTQPGGYNSGVYSATNDVELRDLTVTRTVAGGALPNSPRYGIKFDFADGMVIDNVQVTNSFRTGLDLHGTTDISVNDVTSTGNGGAGIFLTDVKGADLSNITTSGNPWVGVSVATSGQYTALGTNDVVFSGVNSFGESAGDNGGLQLEMFKFGFPAPDPITWSSDPGDAANVTIQSADFGYALSSATFDVAATRYVRFHQSLAQAQSAAAGNADHLVAGGRYIQVADDSNGLPGSGPTDLYVYDTVGDKMSIQAAIDGASTTHTDTVHIGAGSYVGSVSTTGRSVNLSAGASPAQVTLGGNLTLDSNDTLPIELTGTNPVTQFDNFIVNGVMTLGSATLNVSRTFAPSIGTQFKIIDNDSNDPVVGTFNGLAEGAIFYVTGKPFKITYQGGSGNDVVLIAQDSGTLEVVYDKSCYKPGETLTATVRMKNLSGPAAGFQAFLNYNPARLAFTSTPPIPVIYTSAPFGLPVLNTPAFVNPSSGVLNLASGIDQFGGQSPSSADADLAILKFTVLGSDNCSIGGLITFRTNVPPTRLTDINGQELAVLTTVDGPAITIDGTPPTITFCPANLTIQCHESTEPGIPFGVASGGVMIYYNLTGPEAPANQAYLKGQFDYNNTNGSQFTFDPSPLTGFGPLTWPFLFGQVPPPSQFGFDFVLPSPANDSSVPTPVLNSYNNTDNSATGRALAGPVVWKIGDYKDNAPNGPGNAMNVDINSMIKSPSPGNPATDLQITTFSLSQAGPIFTAQVAGKLMSDGLIHWYSPATPDSPMANFGLDGEFFFSGTLTYDSTGDDGSDRKDFFAGNITISANSPNTALGFARATDGCTQFPTITYSDVANLSDCNSTGTITRTWKATDCAGNESTCVQIITVADTTPPVISCPAAAPIQCAELIPLPYANLTAFISAGGTASDNCTAVAGLTLSHLGDGPLTGGSCGGTITRTYQVTDACGNSSTCAQVFTVHDTTAPVATSGGSVAACYPDVASAEAAALALSSATDNCAGPLTSHASTSGTCAAVVSVYFTDTCGNPSNTLTFNTRIDNTPPVITCAADVVVTPPIGVCTAVGVNLGSTTAVDVCTGPVTPTGVRSDSLPLSDPYPQGVTSILWTATDDCGNSSNCTQTVTVQGVSIAVGVELSPTIDAAAYPLTRCITFVVRDCVNNTTETIDQNLTFTYDGFNNRALANATICVPSAVPSTVNCVTARDKLHTLRSTVDLMSGLVQTGPTTFTADFTGKRADEPGAIPMVDVGHRLVGGNLNDDIFIDILDFGTWAGLYLTNYGNGNTTCSTLSPHGDISGDGDVGIGDYSFIAINFLMVAENNCCSMAPIMAGGGEDDESPTPRDGNGPRASITMAELNQLGLSHLAAGDVNHDGVLDQMDMTAVLSGQMPTPVVNEAKGGDVPLPVPTPAADTPSIRPRPRRSRG